jgi:hypothetical protein
MWSCQTEYTAAWSDAVRRRMVVTATMAEGSVRAGMMRSMQTIRSSTYTLIAPVKNRCFHADTSHGGAIIGSKEVPTTHRLAPFQAQ